MTLVPFEIPPGLVRSDSPNAAKGRYTDADKVHFIGKFPEKWGGWQRWLPVGEGDLLGKARGSTAWANADGNQNATFGTHLKLYAVTGEDTLRDITPIRATGTLGADPFDVTDGSAVVTVNHTAHGADSGAFVTFSGADAVGGITIDGEYQLTKIDSDSYTIIHSAAATSTASGGGASVDYAYQINPGSSSTVFGFGWGADTWGSGTWGTPRDTSTGVIIELRYWSLHEYGNELLALPAFGRIYLWEEATDTNAELVTNSPASARFMFITGERFVMALGTTTPMTVDWPDQDDITDWTPTASNTANTRVLQSGSKLMGGTSFADLLNLVWSDSTLYLFQYTGSDFIYEPRIVGKNSGLAAPGAFCVARGVAYWLSGNDFHMYSGLVQAIPNSEDVAAYVFDDIDPNHIFKTYCVFNEIANAVMWGYVSKASTDDEPDKYVEVSLDSYAWSTGTIDRTTATVFRPADGSLLMVDHSGEIFAHEVGHDADGEALEAYITFGLYALGSGAKNVDIMGFVPDCQRQVKTLTVEFQTKDRPNDADWLDEVTANLAVGQGIADVRVEGRHFTWTIRSDRIGGDFRLGIPSLELQEAGERR
jgi:hypothetical protein